MSLGLDLYFDDGTSNEQFTAGQVSDSETDDLSSDGLFAGSATFLSRVLEHVRVGGTFRYFGSYSYARDEDEDADPVELGQLMELTGRAEYLVPLVESLELVGGVEAGLALLIPAGRLADEIDSLQNQGYDTWSVPRIGYVIGPQLGARYMLAEWLALRGDVALQWQRLILLDSHAEAGGVEGERDWTVDWMRVRAGIAAEVVF